MSTKRRNGKTPGAQAPWRYARRPRRLRHLDLPPRVGRDAAPESGPGVLRPEVLRTAMLNVLRRHRERSG